MKKKLEYILIFIVMLTIKNASAQVRVTTSDSSEVGIPEFIVDTTKKNYEREYVNNKDNNKIIRAFSFQMENDVLAGFLGWKNEDKDYSGGFKFEFYTDYLANGILPLLMNRRFPINNRYNVNSIYIQGLGFTPNRDAFSKILPVTDQRPYASLLVVGKKRIAYFDNLFWKRPGQIVTDFYLGQIGGKVNGKVQNWLHRNITDSDIVMGWNNQIANGGAFAFNYNIMATTYLKSWKSKKKSELKNLFIYATPHLSFGNIHKNIGIKLSFSNLSLDKIPILTSIGNAQNATPNAVIENPKAEKEFPNFLSHFRFEIYAKGTKVYYNSLLMGMPIKRYDNSIYTIDKSKILSFMDFGGKLYFFYNPYGKYSAPVRKTSVYFEIVRRGKEFTYGPTHIFGGFGFLIYNLD